MRRTSRQNTGAESIGLSSRAGADHVSTDAYERLGAIPGRIATHSSHLRTGDSLASSMGPSVQVLEGTGESVSLDVWLWWWQGGTPACGAKRVRSPMHRPRHAPWKTMKHARTEARTLTVVYFPPLLYSRQAVLRSKAVRCRILTFGLSGVMVPPFAASPH
jgi:hypothetical protein